MKDDERPIPRHEVRGQGNVLRCPKIDWDVACEGCTCTTPCAEARDVLVVTENYPRQSRVLQNSWQGELWHRGKDIMQSLSLNQGDAVLDLVEQCHRVAHAWEQQVTHKGRTPRVVEMSEYKQTGQKVAQSHAQTVLKLQEIYAECTKLGVDDDILVAILLKGLPTNYKVDLKIEDEQVPEGA